ncbi:cilia- and flagella- associated protein 210 [Octopus bimaculoides]|uniref:cilia- and flagella- associated protein 210 n=1 Tax=Octopus bimaculoides TaxID=37653 RepID=UPI0022E607D1|nr:cilia- and flagella- associated protein 210 [Octopus bimaculoides]
MPKVDVDQVMVLMPEDWERIQYELHMREIEAEKIKILKKNKEEIAEKSKKFVQHWPNTLASLRQKKIEDFKRKQLMEEEEKKQKDIEWAEYQAEVRKNAIAEAKKKMYFQTDRIKGLHRGFQFSETLREREEQIKMKNLQKETARLRAEMSYKELMKENEEMEKMEQKKQDNRKKAVMEQIENLKAKMLINIEEKKQEKEVQKQEQKHLTQLAEEWANEIRQLEKEKKEKSLKFAAERKERIKGDAELRELEKKKEEEEDKACEVYANAKRDMLKMREKRNKELREQRQKYLEVLGLRISNQMKELNDDENERIEKVAQEKENEKLRIEEQKKKNYDIHTEEILANMKAKKEKQEKEEEMKAEHLKALKADIEKYEAEDKHFRSYADSLMEECKKKGWNLYPVEYAAGYKCESSVKQTKKAANMFSENKKEFGYIW